MNSENILKLQEDLETLAGRKMLTRRDFDQLADLILLRTGETISATTLRRLWGYQETDGERTTSMHTLNQLSRAVCGKDWQEYSTQKDTDKQQATASSNFIVENAVLKTETLVFGNQLTVTWAPDRCVVLEFQGGEVFRVIKSHNSKLEVGDTFHCVQFVTGEPLVCHTLIRPGMAITNYICGKQGGIRWTLTK